MAESRVQGGKAERETQRGLKLRARDAEDLKVVSAVLQDSLVAVRDMTYLPREKRFVLVANRFCWERDPEELFSQGADEQPGELAEEQDASFHEAGPRPVYERVHCGITFDQVESVRLRGFDPHAKGEILELLAVEPGADVILLCFAGKAAVRLSVSAIRCHIEDLGEPWPTRWRPSHDLSDKTDAEPSR